MSIKQIPTISIDIGHTNLKILQITNSGKIEKSIVHKMPEGCIDDLTITSEDALIKSLKAAKQKARITRGKCHLVLSGSDIIIRHFVLPKLSEADLYQNILHEVSGYLPVDPSKYFVDYKITGTVIDDDGIEMNEVLVTTVHRRIIQSYKKVLRAAGFTPKVIDTCENACEKLLRVNHQFDPLFSLDGGICMLDLGTKQTRATIYHEGNYYVSNVLKRSSHNITEVISRATGKDMITSETLKQEKKYLNPGAQRDDVTASVTFEVDSLLYEVSRVFDYFRNRTKKKVNTVYLSGGGSLLFGLDEYIQKHLDVPVRYASELIPNTKTLSKTSNNAFLINAYAATYREDS